MVGEEAIAPGPAALAELKMFARIAGGEEDALAAALVASAAALCERFIGQALLAREFGEVIAAGGWTRLARTPVAAVVAVADMGGAALPVADYAVDIDANGDGWVRLDGPARRARVRYRAGLAAAWGDAPEALRHGIVRLAAHLFAKRAADAPPPAAVTALWRPWRRMRIGAPGERRVG